MQLKDVLIRVALLEDEARRITTQHESSRSRTITLDDSYAKLATLSIAQDELFRESLRAIEVGLFRAAHVLAWAGFMDFLHELLGTKYLAAIQGIRSGWNISVPEDFRDHVDFHVIEAGKDAGAYGRTVMKALHGLLNKRNECAHPSGYFPTLNESLGYSAELIQRISKLQGT